ncbi:MAG TPA: hypothetical protein VMT19_01420 [Thermoanaerobaculaceae bacterium]|nr:hypothetical protein [Thermoanaerobaculaceae bacterium]
MRAVVAVVALALAVSAVGEELTVGEVIAAHRAGAPVAGILRLVREAPAVAALTVPDLDRLRGAGVPDEVVRAMLARNAPPTPTPTAAAARPDDATLEGIARLVKAGLSERLVCEQIRGSGRRRSLTANDLVYLKEHAVPDSVISALMETGVAPSEPPTATPVPPSAPVATVTQTPAPPPAATLAFEPLVRMSGTFRKAQTGRLVLTADDLEWSEAGAPSRVERIGTGSLTAVWLSVTRAGQGPAMAELRVRSSRGDDLAFRDPDWSKGGNDRVEALYRAIRDRFPHVVLPENPLR